MKLLFGSVLRDLSPSSAETVAFANHRKSLSKLLKANGASNVIPIGSRRRGTALRDISDFDLLVQFPRKLLIRRGREVSSGAALNRIRKAVSLRYPLTSVRTDKQAVVVGFQSTGASIDLVPAFFAEPGADFKEPARNYPVYKIPDGYGGWIASSPHAYDTLLSAADKRSGHKLRRVSQLLKLWANCYSPALPLSSFAFEMLLVQTDICRPGRSYSHCLWSAFKLLASREAYRLSDPLLLSDEIRLSRTLRQSALIRKRARLARIEARRAIRERNPRESLLGWERVFNHKIAGR